MPHQTDGEDARETVVVFVGARKSTGDRYALDHLFLEWAWNAGFRDWDMAVRTLARTLHALQASGLIERRTIRRVGHPTHHGLVVTELGQQALHALSGEWFRLRDGEIPDRDARRTFKAADAILRARIAREDQQ